MEEYLNCLQKKFVIVTIDKAANNFAFICKGFYIIRLLQEVGLGDDGGNATYSRVMKATLEIVKPIRVWMPVPPIRVGGGGSILTLPSN